jgi:ATP-dependent Lhr-like helicase
VIWIGRKDGGDKEGKAAFFLAESRELYAPCLPAEEQQGSSRHPELLERLKTGGASFLTRLAQETGRLPSEVLSDLFDLVWEGRVSNDQFAPLRQSGRSRGKAGFVKAGSGLGRWYWTGALLADQESAFEGANPTANPANPANPASPASPASRPALTRPVPGGRTDPHPAVRWVHHLLQTYGVLTKDLVNKICPYDWETLLPVLKQLEEWGAVTRGAFIRGLQTLQFTTRELAEEIRKPLPAEDAAPVTVLSSVDPANPYGQIVEWPSLEGASFARKTGNDLVLCGDRWVYWIENGGKRIFTVDENGSDPRLAESTLRTAFAALLKRQGLSKITVEQWNGQAVLETEAADRLRALGAERDRNAFVLWKSELNR